jgi:hypothetical protein
LRELLKLLPLRTTEAGDLAGNAALRLIARNEAGDLVPAWLSDAPEGGTAIIEVPGSLLADIAGDKACDAARAELGNGPFVDVGKLLVTPELPVPPWSDRVTFGTAPGRCAEARRPGTQARRRIARRRSGAPQSRCKYRSTVSTVIRRCAATWSGASISMPKLACQVWRFDTR